MNFKLTFVLLFCTCFCLITNAQSIRINEIVSSNSTVIDEDGDTPDWLELYNYGATPVSLLNWGLTDDADDLHSWQFPNVTLNPDEYMLVWASDKDRGFSFARTLVNQGDIHNYLVPNAEPDADWNEKTFNDSSWENGPSGFGYDDDENDYATQIAEGTNSLYTRITFGMENLASLTKLILDVDYDDSFVAYINGVEVARANIDGVPPSYDANANDYVEANIAFGGDPERFIIDNADTILTEGDNVLAIQLHNFNATSSDLTLIPFLSAIFSEDTTIGISPPELLKLQNGKLHTNFKISSSSEDLYLTDANQNIIDHVLVENLASDISYGVSINSENFVNYVSTTPGAVNSDNEFSGTVTTTVIFSHEGGAVNEPVNLVLSGNSIGQTIRYTTDATIPTENDLVYTNPIQIETNTVVRARIFEPNQIPSVAFNKSFVFNSNHQIDVIYLTTEPDNFFDEDTGIYVFGPEENHEIDFPFMGANFWQDWERPIHFAYYKNNSTAPAVEYNAGVKIFGGWSRGHAQKSLSLFARGQYGASEFEYPFFEELDYDEFESVVLRNSGNDWLASSIKDISLTSLMTGTDLDFQAYHSVATYLNGEYWGMYNMREKTNEHMLASKHDIDADDITMLEKDSEVIEGSNDEYLELIDYINTTDLSIDANFEYVSERVDIENYALYQVAQIFFNNTDWPNNNIKYWKHLNGKWRWILFDTDFGFGPPWDTRTYTNDALGDILDEDGPFPEWSTLLFRRLNTNINFRNTFINRYADELNTRFLPDNVKNHIETVYQSVQSEIPAAYERWDGDPDNALRFVDDMKDYADARPDFVKEHILSAYELPGLHPITITNNSTSFGFVMVNNNLEIKEATWTGDYFETVPVQLTAVAEAGYEFSHWSGDVESTDVTISVNLTASNNVIPNFIETTTEAIVINEINYKSGDEFDADDWIELYNPNDTAIDMSNWQLKDSNDDNIFVIPSGTLIQANAFIVLVKDTNDFTSVYPNITNFIGEIDFGFGGEDAVRLFNNQGVLQDQVSYDDSWPSCADGTGQTLELNDATADNSLPENWSCINTIGSPNRDNNEVVLSIEDNEFLNDEVTIYPNPVNDTLNILGVPNIESIQIFDINGRQVSLEKEEITNEINVKELSEGFYLIKIQDTQKSSTLQFIKN